MQKLGSGFLDLIWNLGLVLCGLRMRLFAVEATLPTRPAWTAWSEHRDVARPSAQGGARACPARPVGSGASCTHQQNQAML